MKYLIASSGNSLDSFVVKRFEHAAWYLIVDEHLNSIEAKQHLSPHDRHEILAKAIAEHVRAVIAGKFGDNALKTMVEHDLDSAIIHGVTAREALQKIRSHDTLLVNAEQLLGEKEKAGDIDNRNARKREQLIVTESAGYTADTARGQHHLQQYGGRGH
jgi:predicted Fe-Mo cluster-binding NifX family protein